MASPSPQSNSPLVRTFSPMRPKRSQFPRPCFFSANSKEISQPPVHPIPSTPACDTLCKNHANRDTFLAPSNYFLMCCISAHYKTSCDSDNGQIMADKTNVPIRNGLCTRSSRSEPIETALNVICKETGADRSASTAIPENESLWISSAVKGVAADQAMDSKTVGICNISHHQPGVDVLRVNIKTGPLHVGVKTYL